MNKQMKLFFILFVSTLCLGFTSCDDDEVNTDLAKEVEGTYTGTITIPMMEGMIIENANITIKRTAKNKVILGMDQDLGIGKNIKVDVESDVIIHSDNTYAVSGDTVFELGDIESSLPLPSSLPVNVKGTITTSGKANIIITLAGVVEATFEGDKK